MGVLERLKPRAADGLQPTVAVAYSGGADSTALLVETHQKYPQQTMAFHVHHGLQAAADDFVQHCQRFCDHLQIPLYVAYVNGQSVSGQSPEDAARSVRYQALIELALSHRADKVLLAQHIDDQIETLLLALSRGAGLGGLAAMPIRFERGGVHFERPMLHSRTALDIRNKLKEAGLAYIEDPTNSDKAFTRNKIRLDVLPSLQAAFPEYTTTFVRSISHMAEANDLLAELAGIDLATVGIPPHIKALQLLSRQRQANLIRFWLKSEHGVIPSTVQLDELLKQILNCRTKGHQIHLKIASGFVSRAEDVLRYN